MLPRNEPFFKQIVASTVYAYNAVMSNYTKNTGGGDGDDTAIVLRKERDEVEIVNYYYKIRNSVYLTVVHIYNKLYHFPLVVVVKYIIPTEFQIDDSMTELISSMSSRQKPNDSRTPDNKQYRKNKQII